MRKILLGLVLVATLIGPTPAQAGLPVGASGIGDSYFPLDGNGGIDVRRYDVHDRYRFATRTLSGWTAVRLVGTQSVSTFDLDFLLPVSAVTVEGARVPFRHLGHELVVQRPLARGERVTVRVTYAGHPDRYAYAGEHNWLADAGEVVAMNEPHMAPWWFPSNDHPRDRARMRISITVPRGDQVVSNGTQRTVRRGAALATYTWASKQAMVPYLAFFAAGHFDIARGISGKGVPWLVAVSRQLDQGQRSTAMKVMKRSGAITDWLSGQLGRFPFDATGGLTTALPIGFALENQTRPTYPYLGGGPLAVSFVVHELAHQWFGDDVSLHDWRDVWLNEGFATFMEWRWTETHGGASAAQVLRREYADATSGLWSIPADDPGVSQIWGDSPYLRGAMTLQALRQRIGNADFWRLLHAWVGEHGGGSATNAQFEALAARVSGQDLHSFFLAWLHTAAKPAATAANGLA